jgi:hypothetical protein
MFNPLTGVHHSVSVERFLKQEQGCSARKELATLSPEKLSAIEPALQFALGLEEE